LWIVKGSHKFPNHVRGPGYLFPKFYHLEGYLKPLMEPMAMQAGQALIFYHRVLHGSPPNQTDTPRAVVAMSVLPGEVPLHIFFQKDADSPLECYHPHDEFIYEFENVRDQTAFHPPSGAPVTVEAPFQQYNFTEEWFNSYYAGEAALPDLPLQPVAVAADDGAASPKLGFWDRLWGRKLG
jgi:hypothetical protein